ncbi:MAG: hypothetical protein A2808_02800 [Candidatus Moranbacteria bacterium RIFCSPHIGHO2_01_FULL_55_24]|nr:MAG: hypothetical protein A2808_02800 [Candidatus Moranbacteria bacterium RIFCSPHIGHO2_01_FULL_55_24]
MGSKRSVVLVAHDIRSAHNVGAFFRTANGAGVEKIYLSGYTPTPSAKKHFLSPAEKALRKTALGAEESVPWEKHEAVLPLLAELKARGYMLVALEQSEGSVDYRTALPAEKIALLVGNEVEGVPQEALRTCDMILEIPMRGNKNSLNVSVAAGIALYQITGTIGDDENKHEK